MKCNSLYSGLVNHLADDGALLYTVLKACCSIKKMEQNREKRQQMSKNVERCQKTSTDVEKRQKIKRRKSSWTTSKDVMKNIERRHEKRRKTSLKTSKDVMKNVLKSRKTSWKTSKIRSFVSKLKTDNYLFLSGDWLNRFFPHQSWQNILKPFTLVIYNEMTDTFILV